MANSVLMMRSAWWSAVETKSPGPFIETWRCSTSPKSWTRLRAALRALERSIRSDVRQMAEDSDGLVLSGQAGLCHLAHASNEEVQHADDAVSVEIARHIALQRHDQKAPANVRDEDPVLAEEGIGSPR